MRALLLLPLLALFVACATTGPTSQPRPTATTPAPANTVVVRAIEHRFILPAHWPTGWVDVTLLDDGAEPHQLQLASLRPGATLPQVTRDFATSPAAAFAQLLLAGGPDVVEPGLGQRATLRLAPGSYVALDLSVGADGVQNVSKGMIQPFTADLPASGPAPVAQGTLVERSFMFDLPAIPAGPAVIEVRNASAGDAHMATIVQPDPGKALGDVLAYLDAPAGPPPFRFLGGMAALEPGQSGFLDLDLDPGNYVVLCLVTDPATGRFHFDEGMAQAFTVTGR